MNRKELIKRIDEWRSAFFTNKELADFIATLMPIEKPSPLTPTNEHKGRLCYFWDGMRPNFPDIQRLHSVDGNVFHPYNDKGDKGYPGGVGYEYAELLTGMFMRPHDVGARPVDKNTIVLRKSENGDYVIYERMRAELVDWEYVTGYLTDEDLKNAQPEETNGN